MIDESKKMLKKVTDRFDEEEKEYSYASLMKKKCHSYHCHM
jgi:hypothetical protein